MADAENPTGESEPPPPHEVTLAFTFDLAPTPPPEPPEEPPEEELPPPLTLDGTFFEVTIGSGEEAPKFQLAHPLSGEEGPESSKVEITVTDTGCGMTEETKAKLFEPYYTTKGSDKGTGLGLSISADIVAEHHGQLLVESQLNQGTTFILRIPINFQ